jgi:hypothetical protein
VSADQAPKSGFALEPPPPEILVARCHDIAVSLNGQQVGDFDQLLIYGMAVRLALHLRGCPPVPYDLLKMVALHRLHIPPTSLRTVVEVLAEAEFVKVDQQGKTIRAIVPTVPFYEDLFGDLGALAADEKMSEPEMLTLSMLDRLAKSPVVRETIYNSGADRKLIDRMLDVAKGGGFLLQRRARGRDMLVSPLYFPENPDAIANVTAAFGATPTSRVLSALAENQGYPLSVAIQSRTIGNHVLAPEDVPLLQALAEDAVVVAPSITTEHAGQNFFLFTPVPGTHRILPTKRHIYEAAMALVAAVRQGQLLPAKFRIKYPVALLNALKEKGYLRATTEALQQYRALAVLRVGHLEKRSGGFYQFRLIGIPENLEAVNMAINLVAGGEQPRAVDDEATLAFHKGHEYVDSLVSRQALVQERRVALDSDTQSQIDDFFLQRGGQ